MTRISTHPVAPASSDSGGAAPYFSAKLGAWVRQPEIAQRARQGFVQPAAKRPGNVTLSQHGKIWLAILIYCGACWAAFVWIVHDLYISGGLR